MDERPDHILLATVGTTHRRPASVTNGFPFCVRRRKSGCELMVGNSEVGFFLLFFYAFLIGWTFINGACAQRNKRKLLSSSSQSIKASQPSRNILTSTLFIGHLIMFLWQWVGPIVYCDTYQQSCSVVVKVMHSLLYIVLPGFG